MAYYLVYLETIPSKFIFLFILSPISLIFLLTFLLPESPLYAIRK